MQNADLVWVRASWQNLEDGSTVNYSRMMRLDRIVQLIDLMDAGEEPPEEGDK